jgi:photosystem II stability/assembly factor-like uncharacterized protein
MKKITVSLLVISLCWCAASAQQSNKTRSKIAATPDYFKNWTIAEIAKGGRIDAIRQIGPNTVLCATRGLNRGRLFISHDNGVSWSFLAQPVTTDITCIGETGRPDEFYILTGTAEVWGTRDGGKTWQHLKTLLEKNKNREVYAAAYAIMYTSKGSLLVTDTDSDGGHIYRSVDKGITWQDLGAISENALYRLEKTGDGIIVNGWQGVVYKSTNDGVTWNKTQQLSDAALFATEYLGKSVLLQADQSGNIFRSSNGGRSWDKVAHFPESADDFINIGYGAAYYGTYTKNKTVYLTTNYGKTWLPLDSVSTVTGDWIDHGIQISTRDSVIGVAGTNKGFIIRKAFQKKQLKKVMHQINNAQK